MVASRSSSRVEAVRRRGRRSKGWFVFGWQTTRYRASAVGDLHFHLSRAEFVTAQREVTLTTETNLAKAC
jgi:alkylhydroperoxidase family enzyme